MKVKWVFQTPGDVYGTPSVVDGLVYVGDTSGTFYALRSSGAIVWKTNVGSPITDSALVTNQMVIFGDQAGYIHGLNRVDGSKAWSVKPNPNSGAAIFGSPILVGGQVVIGISSNERSGKATFRGSVARLDPNTGAIVWQTYLITDEEQAHGASGAGIWSTPTYDVEADLVYVTTGNNYAEPATETSDAFIALKGASGQIVWKHQMVQNDIGTIEADIGDSPQVYRLASGQKVVGAGEKKTGVYSVLDAQDGHLVRQIRVVPDCTDSLGLFADSAISDGVVFVNGVNCIIPAKPPLVPPTGAVAALESDASKKLWEFTSLFAPVLSGLAVANGVVYAHTSGLYGTLYALDAKTGRVLAGVLTSGGISGPSVSHGQIYVGTGTKFASGFGILPPGVVAIGP
ncbi:MAG: PQQ-binding-like beta-propeller repeat protein [Verrucomicrobia bacterium]|nr:PQQ-binding-like beta-propeller repeat protein [Verrucomicrobiota bacterium]